MSPARADAQFWRFWRKKPAVPASAITVPAPSVPTPSALLPQAPTDVPSATDPNAAQRAEKERYAREARLRDGTRDLTSQNAQDRLTAWSLVRAIDPFDPESLRGQHQAREDLDRARALEAAQRAKVVDSTTLEAVRLQLQGAQADFDAGKLDQAERVVDQVLAVHTDDPQARSLKAAVAAKRDARRSRWVRLIIGLALLVAAVGVGALTWWALKRRRAYDAAVAARPALIKVVDGVGRGRLISVQRKVCRIGSMASEDAAEKNDLILSDSASLISRHHCTIVRKSGAYFLIDSSLNGTRLNDEALERGEHHRLIDGDEIVIARASRLKFLTT